jgi:hypothetical protein
VLICRKHTVSGPTRLHPRQILRVATGCSQRQGTWEVAP